MRDEPCISHRCIIRDCFSPESRYSVPSSPLFSAPWLSASLSPLSFPVPRPTKNARVHKCNNFRCTRDNRFAAPANEFSPAPIAKSASAAAQRDATQRNAMPAALTGLEFLRSFSRTPRVLRPAIDGGLLSLSRSRAASFARLILRSRGRNFCPAVAAGANSHGRSAIAKHSRESAFVDRQQESYPTFLPVPLPFPPPPAWTDTVHFRCSCNKTFTAGCRRAITTPDSAVRP